jgi:hypothetical protein
MRQLYVAKDRLHRPGRRAVTHHIGGLALRTAPCRRALSHVGTQLTTELPLHLLSRQLNELFQIVELSTAVEESP